MTNERLIGVEVTMVALAELDAPEKLGRLFGGVRLEVEGNGIDDQTRDYLDGMYRSGETAVLFKMEDTGLYPTVRRRERLVAERIEPTLSRGLVEGYTDKERSAHNLYTVPGTSEYSGLRRWISGLGGRFGAYLYRKFGTPKRAEMSNRKTFVHESVHKHAQLRETRTRDGKKADPFAEVLYRNLIRKFERCLQTGKEWFAPYLAAFASRNVLEGLTELTTDNITEDKSAMQVYRERRSMPITTYDPLAADAAEACYDMGLQTGNEGLDLVGRTAENPSYVSGFTGRSRMVRKMMEQAKNLTFN